MLAYRFSQTFRGLGFFKIGNLLNTWKKMPPKKRSKRRGSQETERMSTRARSPETQQAAGVEELVVGVEDPLEMLDSEQGDIGLETQQESDTSDEDTQDTQAAAATTQKGKDTGKARLTKGARNPQFSSVLSRNRS